MEEPRVRDIMTAEVTTLKRNDNLTLAEDIMHLGRIRHLPVLDDDGQQLVGMVSQRDLFHGSLARAWLWPSRSAKGIEHAAGQRGDEQRRDHDDPRNTFG
jgi:CBS-domain-containing membrane protein